MRNGEYELIVPPPEYPGKRYRGKYAYEHRVNYWLEHGELPPVVHHKNEKKRDNAKENLEGHEVGEHTAMHSHERRAADIELTCAYCGSKFTRRARDIQWKLNKGQTQFCCSQSCGGLLRRGEKHGGGKHPEHGAYAYQHGCRCVVCRRANADRRLDWKRRKRDELAKLPTT